MDKRAASMFSLCQKAGLLVSGESACEKALRAGEAKLVIVCSDASDNTKKKFVNKSFFYNVPCYTCFLKEEISHAIGRENRAAIVIKDNNFASKIEELVKGTCL